MQEYKSCFSKGYWKSALGELRKTRSIAICALFVALRVAVKSLRIYLIPGQLYIGFDFVINSLGAMIYGPVLALIGGLISDTIGALLFPSGPYFFPFALIEMASGFIFALFLYRAKLSSFRIILARFSVVTICNFVMTPAVMLLQGYIQGNEVTMKFYSLTRILKNACALPVESLILILLLGSISIPLARKGLVPYSNQKVRIDARSIVFIVTLTLLSVGALILYFLYKTK